MGWYNQGGYWKYEPKVGTGYGKKPIFTTKKNKYTNNSVKSGTKYYYKARGYVIINGEKVYTDWSKKAIRTAKQRSNGNSGSGQLNPWTPYYKKLYFIKYLKKGWKEQ